MEELDPEMLAADAKRLEKQVTAFKSQLREIRAEIRTNTRLFDTLKAEQPYLVDETLKRELYVRDRQIESLNGKLVEALAGIKETQRQALNEKDKEIEKLNKTITDQAKQQTKHNEAINKLKDANAKLWKQADEQVEESEILQSALQEELDVMKKEIELKENAINDQQGDLAQLSKIVGDMTTLNRELNEKISSLNEDIEALNAENFSNKSKAEMSEELEANLADQVEENNKLVLEAKKNNAIIQGYTKFKEMVEECYTQQATELGLLEKKMLELMETTENEPTKALQDTADKIVEIRQALKVTMLATIPEASDENANAVEQLHALQKTLAERMKQVRAIETEKKLLVEKMDGVNALMAKCKEDQQGSEKRMQVRFDRISEDNTRLKKRLQEVTDDLSKSEIDLAKAENDGISKTTRIEALKKKLSATAQSVSDSEKAMREISQSLSRSTKEKTNKDREIQQQNSKISRMANLMQTYEDEMFSRDSEVIKKDSKITALQNQISNIKRNQNKALSKSRSDNQASMQQILLIKEQEIAALKSMIKPGGKSNINIFGGTLQEKQTASQRNLQLSAVSPLATKSQAGATGRINPRSSEGAVITIILNLCHNAREIRKWRNEKMKALRAAGTESATITLNKVYEILGETRDEALDEEEEGEPRDILNRVYKMKNDTLAEATQEKLDILASTSLNVDELKASVRYEAFHKVLPDAETVTNAELSALIPNIL